MDLLTALTALAAVALVAILAATHRNSHNILTAAVGGSAGLIAMQFANVHLFTILVTLWWLLAPRQPGRGLRPLLIPAVVLPVAVTALVGDLVNNPLLALQFLALSINAAMIASRVTSDDVKVMLRGLLIVCTAASLVGIGQVAGIIPNVGFHTDLLVTGRPYAFYPEPDWAGLFSTLGVILAYRTLPLRSTLTLGVLLVNIAGSGLALARASWVALAVSVVVVVGLALFSRQGRARRPGRAKAALAIGAVAVVGLAVLPDIRDALLTRLDSLINPNTTTDISGRARVQQLEGLQRLGESAPWYGHGVSASGRVGVSGIYNPESGNNLGSNWLLALWVDAKFLALPFIAVVLGLAARTARSIPGQLLVFLCIHNLFSNATVQPIMWLVLGLVVAAPQSQVVYGQTSTASAKTAPKMTRSSRSLPRRSFSVRP